MYRRLGGSRKISISDPNPQDILLSDITRSLPRVHRFGAQAPYGIDWTVREHSMVVHRMAVMDQASKAVRRATLGHDLHEYLAGDMPTPCKKLVPDFKIKIEKPIEAALAERFGLATDPATRIEVKGYDLRSMFAEAHIIMQMSERDLIDWAETDGLAKDGWGEIDMDQIRSDAEIVANYLSYGPNARAALFDLLLKEEHFE